MSRYVHQVWMMVEWWRWWRDYCKAINLQSVFNRCWSSKFHNITFASLQVWQLRIAWLSVVMPVISYLFWSWFENHCNYVVLKMWNTTQTQKHGWPQPFSWSSLVHKINILLFVDKCASHLQDILFLRHIKFLYNPPNTHAWCLP